MYSRQVYRSVFSDIATQRIRESKCPNCGKPKSEWNRRTSWRCCCVGCTQQFWKEHNISNDWSVIRARAFKRDDYTCKMCGQRSQQHSGLIGDHIIPISVGGDEFDINNVQTLCIDCNKIKTAQDMKIIAEYRAKEKILKKNRILLT